METLDTQGIALPRLGLGTYLLKDAAGQAAVESALALGYRHIDTAAMYDNEAAVGAGIAAAGLPRAELHVTTKVWYDQLAPEAMRRSLEASLARLGLGYVDLFLIHWPAPDMDLPAAMAGLAALKEEGLTRAIGVSNFPLALLRRAVEEIGAPVACNQVEYHVYLGQKPLLDYQRGKGIPLVAYSPVAQGKLEADPVLRDLADKHEATPSQIGLAWLLDQKGVAAIPKAGRRESQQANLDALRIRLDDEDRLIIGALPKTRRLIDPAFAPAWD